MVIQWGFQPQGTFLLLVMSVPSQSAELVMNMRGRKGISLALNARLGTRDTKVRSWF